MTIEGKLVWQEGSKTIDVDWVRFVGWRKRKLQIGLVDGRTFFIDGE